MADDARLQIVLEAKIDNLISKLGQANSATSSWAKSSQQHIDDTDNKFNHLFGSYDPGLALERIFDSSRLKLLDSGIARIGLFGSALQDLGPIGIGVAVAISSLGGAITQALTGAQWAEEITDVSAKLAVSTGRLQELQFAFQTIGIAPKAFNEQIATLNESLGQLQSGEPRAKILLEELKITPDQVKGFTNVDSFISALPGLLSNAGSAAEQARILQRLGVPDWLPLLQQPVGAIQALEDKFKEFGLELDDSVVKKGADANATLHQSAALIKGELRQSFIDLAPAVAGISTLIAELIRGFNQLIEKIRNFGSVNAFGDLAKEIYTSSTKIEQINSGFAGAVRAGVPIIQAMSAGGRKQAAGQEQINLNLEEDRMKRIGTIQNTTPTPQNNPPAKTLIPPKVKKISDQTTNDTDNAQKALDEAVKAEAAARAAATQGIIDQAELEKAANLDAAQVTKDALQKQIDKITKDETDGKISTAKGQQLILELQKAKGLEDQVAVEKNKLVDEKTEETYVQQRLAYQSQINSYVTGALQIASSMAKTAADRRTIELQILKIQQDQLAQELAASTDKQVKQQLISQDQADALVAKQQTEFQAQQTQVIHATMGPLEAWKDQAIVTANQIDEAYQKVEVDGLNSLTDGITAAITQTKTLGDAFHDVALSIISDLVKIAVQKNITQPLAGLLGLGGGGGGGGGDLYGLDGAIFGGSAIGTDFSPGGPTIVGENGPELLNLPKGSQVVPNGLLKSLATLSTPRASPSAGGPINLTVQVDASDSVLTDTVQGWVAAGVQQAIVASGQRVPTIVSDSLRRRIIQR